MKVFIISYGCKLNQTLSRTLDMMKDTDVMETENESEADAIIVSGCAVTSKAESEFRRKVASLRSKYADKRIIATGCVPDNAFSSLKNIEYASQNPSSEERSIIPGRTRENIVIQTGCSSFCSYCIVPYMRGREVSVDRNIVLKRAEKAVDGGIKEIVLTGVHILRYNDKTGGFASLLRDIKKSGIKRVRLTSLDIDRIDSELLEEISSDEKTARYMHLSLQHTDSRILKLMKRNYDTEGIISRITNIKKAIPDMRFGADIIVGFPGETENEFSGMLNILRILPLTHFHIFTYSKRKGTLASYMQGAVSAETAKERHERVSQAAIKAFEAYADGIIGKREEIIIERAENGIYRGTSSHYLQMTLESDKAHKRGEMLKVTAERREGSDIICLEDEGEE